MGRRHRFSDEMQYQAAMAQKERARQAAAAERERVRLEKGNAPCPGRRCGGAQTHGTHRAAAAQAEREAKRLHLEAQQTRVESLNANLREELAAIDSVLESTWPSTTTSTWKNFAEWPSVRRFSRRTYCHRPRRHR